MAVPAVVNAEGRRQLTSIKIGPSEAVILRADFLRRVMLEISDADEGLRVTAAKVLEATWQRCCKHFLHNPPACAEKIQRRLVSASNASVCARESARNDHLQWRVIAEHFRPTLPNLARGMGTAERDILPYRAMPRAHRSDKRSLNRCYVQLEGWQRLSEAAPTRVSAIQR